MKKQRLLTAPLLKKVNQRYLNGKQWFFEIFNDDFVVFDEFNDQTTFCKKSV